MIPIPDDVYTDVATAAAARVRVDYRAFQTESNRIEGIDEVRDAEVEALRDLVETPTVYFTALAGYVDVCQPGAYLRAEYGADVRVGSHVAPPGGPEVIEALEDILHHANRGSKHPYHIHQRYEALHPFTDGNGRSGRALWLWQMVRRGDRRAELGFLHAWYYQSLEHGR